MKSQDAARAEAARWLERHATAEVSQASAPWSGGPRIALLNGQPTARTLGQRWESDYQPWALRWFKLTLPFGVTLREDDKPVGATRQVMPIALTFASIEAVADFAGSDWPERLTNLKSRWALLKSLFPETAAASELKRAAALSDVDFELLLQVAQWFRTAEAGWRALTNRQIPIEGVHAKWLQTKQTLVADLAGLPDIKMAERPSRLHLTYADPRQTLLGRRRHDSYTVGDHVQLEYEPQAVLICENKDTVVMFPDCPGLIVIEGDGDAASARLPDIAWVRAAKQIVYWGDIDAKGFVILNRLRERGIYATSIFMDPETQAEFEKFGTNHEQNNKPIPVRPRLATPLLTDDERTVYHRLTDPGWAGHRRIEQERIPLPRALQELEKLLAQFRVTAEPSMRHEDPSAATSY